MSIDLDNLPVGTEVKIVDKWSDETNQNSMGNMDRYLGYTYPILRQTYAGYNLSIPEDSGCIFDGTKWHFNKYCFKAIRLPDTEYWYEIKNGEIVFKDDDIPKELVEDKAKYYVFVSGKQTPKVLHDTIEAAEKEAKRLSEREVGSLVSICRIEKQFISKVIVEEV